MAEEIKLNKVDKIKSTSENGIVDKAMESFLLEKAKELGGNIYLVVFKHHEISIGEVKEGKLILDRKDQLNPEYLKELRMFSPIGELYTWNRDGTFRYRLRIDHVETDDEENIYDEAHYMWCSRPDENDEFAAFEPNRGMRLTFPFKVKDKSLPLKYRVRNYFKYEKDSGLIRFYDARFVRFLDSTGKELNNG